jgi:nitrate reductase NapAB chaperone NapD
MSNELEYVKPEPEQATWNTCLYGPTGNGKTMGACSAPGPILLVNAEGPDRSRKAHAVYGDKIREVKLDKTNASKTLERVFLLLREEDCDIKTVIFDTAGEIYQALIDEASNSGKISLPMRGDASTKLERYYRSVRDLPNVNMVVIAQEQVEDGEEEQLRIPMCGPRVATLSNKVQEFVSILAYIGEIPAEGDTPRRWVGQLVEKGGRRAKDSSGGLGDFRDLDLTDWFETATAAMSENDNNKEAKAA